MKDHSDHSLSLILWLAGALLLVLGAAFFFNRLKSEPIARPGLSATDFPPGIATNTTMPPAGIATLSLEAAPLPNRLRINLDAYPLVLDPQRALLPKEIAHLNLIYQGLTRLGESLEAVPAAAETWAYNSDSTQLIFTLRGGLRYSDGSLLNALRFARALQRGINPQTASGYAWLLDPISGAREWRLADPNAPGYQSQAYLSRLGIYTLDAAGQPCTGYDQPDCLVLRLEFTQPAPYFHYIAGLWLAYPVKEELVAAGGEGWWNAAANRIGNGPFILKDLEPFVRARFTPNPYYTGEQPRLEMIEFTYISNAQTALRAYLNNQLDVIATNPEMLAVIQSSGSLLQQHLIFPGACSSAIRFKWSEPPEPGAAVPPTTGQDKLAGAATQVVTSTQVVTGTQLGTVLGELKLRQAFAWAFDSRSWSGEIDSGFSIPSWTWIPPGFPGHDPDYQPYAFDLEKARQALGESRYGEPAVLNALGLKLAFLDNPYNRQRYAWLAQIYRRNLGIELALQPLDEATFTALNKEPEQYSLFTRQTWCAPYPDPHAWLSAYWLDEFSLRQDQAYELPGFAELIQAADAATNSAERLILYRQAQRLLLADAPGALGHNSTNHYLVKPWVKGLMTSPYDNVWPGSQFSERIFIAP